MLNFHHQIRHRLRQVHLLFISATRQQSDSIWITLVGYRGSSGFTCSSLFAQSMSLICSKRQQPSIARTLASALAVFAINRLWSASACFAYITDFCLRPSLCCHAADLELLLGLFIRMSGFQSRHFGLCRELSSTHSHSFLVLTCTTSSTAVIAERNKLVSFLSRRSETRCSSASLPKGKR